MTRPAARSTSVLLIGNYGPSQAVTRVLARSGYRVIVGDGGEFAVASRSRYCAEVWRHPTIEDPESFMAAMLDLLAARPEIGVVLPLLPGYVAVLSANRARIPEGLVLAMTDPRAAATCLDKERMYAIAEEVGVPFRPLALATDLPSLIAAADEVGYPCVVRPPSDIAATLSHQRKALIVRDRAAIERELSPWPEDHAALIVQRFAAGPRYNVHFAARAGRILARAQTMSLKTDRFDKTGLGVAGVSVRADPRLDGYCAALLERLEYTGVGLVQFIVPADEEPSFLEVNPRLGTAIAFIQYCGLDLVNAAIDLASGDGVWRPPKGARYPVGKRYAWTSMDLYGLSQARARGELSAAQAVRWLARAASAALAADVHLSWSLRDPMPTLAIWSSLMRRVVAPQVSDA